MNICAGGHPCAAAGRVSDYPRDRCCCRLPRTRCPVAHQQDIHISGQDRYRVLIPYLSSSILLTDKVLYQSLNQFPRRQRNTCLALIQQYIWTYVYVTIPVLLQDGYLITPGIVAFVARHVGAVLWPINEIFAFFRSRASTVKLFRT